MNTVRYLREIGGIQKTSNHLIFTHYMLTTRDRIGTPSTITEASASTFECM